MASAHCDPADSEFQKLLHRQAIVDLTTVALELARDIYPGLEFSPVRDWIAERAGELSGPIARSLVESDALKQLGQWLTSQHGLCGETDDAASAEAACLNRVIQTGRGASLSLSLIAMAVAERLGLELRGVDTPLRFLTRLETAEGPLFLDMIGGGRVLGPDECLNWLCRNSGLPTDSVKATLKPVDPRAIVIRMLSDLKQAHVRNENWPAAWKTQQRLAALQPASYAVRRDLAGLLLRIDRPGQAVDLLQACLRVCPSADQPALRAQLDRAHNGLSRWN